MKKKSQEELGKLITREILSMLKDERIAKEDRLDMLLHIIFDMDVHNTPYLYMADALKSGYIECNSKYLGNIERKREYNRVSMAKKYQKAKTMEVHNTPLVTILDKTNKEINKDNIPLNPPEGVAEEIDQCPPAIEVESLLPTSEHEELKRAAQNLVQSIERTQAYGHMRVNTSKLMKCLISIFKKNGGAEKAASVSARIIEGIKTWTEKWEEDDWQYAPGKITDFLYDGKYLQEPRKRAAVSVGSGCGTCGVEIG